MLCSLEHKQHVVMVFESMQMNLRETLKKFGRKVRHSRNLTLQYLVQSDETIARNHVLSPFL